MTIEAVRTVPTVHLIRSMVTYYSDLRAFDLPAEKRISLKLDIMDTRDKVLERIESLEADIPRNDGELHKWRHLRTQLNQLIYRIKV